MKGWSIIKAFVLLGVLAGFSTQIQGQSVNLSQNPYANDPCGDPRVESSFWISVSGRVLTVIDGNTISIFHKKQRVLVHLSGIEAPALDQPFGRDAQALLERLVKSKNVDVWVNPSSLGRRTTPKEIIGVVYLRRQDMLDVNLELVTAGLARHKRPPPYSMSNYTSCRYHKAEEQAQIAKRGLWSMQ